MTIYQLDVDAMEELNQIEEHEREDAFAEEFLSEEIHSTDDELIDVARRQEERDAKVEKRILLQMNIR